MEKCISCVYYSQVNKVCEFELSLNGSVKEVKEDDTCINFEDEYFATKER